MNAEWIGRVAGQTGLRLALGAPLRPLERSVYFLKDSLGRLRDKTQWRVAGPLVQITTDRGFYGLTNREYLKICAEIDTVIGHLAAAKGVEFSFAGIKFEPKKPFISEGLGKYGKRYLLSSAGLPLVLLGDMAVALAEGNYDYPLENGQRKFDLSFALDYAQRAGSKMVDSAAVLKQISSLTNREHVYFNNSKEALFGLQLIRRKGLHSGADVFSVLRTVYYLRREVEVAIANKRISTPVDSETLRLKGYLDGAEIELAGAFQKLTGVDLPIDRLYQIAAKDLLARG